jgi:hypothetical protein
VIYDIENTLTSFYDKKELKKKVDLASNTFTSIEELEKLQKDKSISVRLALITNPSAPDHIIKFCINDCMPVLLRRLFSEKRYLSPRVIKFLYESGHVNTSLGMYDKTPTYMLEELASTLANGIVATNPNVTTQCLLNMDYNSILLKYFYNVIKTDIVTPEIIRNILYAKSKHLSKEFYQHKYAQIEDIVTIASRKGETVLRIALLCRDEDGLFEKFSAYMKEQGVDVSELPDSMIYNLMGWSE